MQLDTCTVNVLFSTLAAYDLLMAQVGPAPACPAACPQLWPLFAHRGAAAACLPGWLQPSLCPVAGSFTPWRALYQNPSAILRFTSERPRQHPAVPVRLGPASLPH